MASGSIYRKCEESDQEPLKELEAEMTSGRAGNSLEQVARGLNREAKSVLTLYAVHAVSFVLWAVLLAVVIAKLFFLLGLFWFLPPASTQGTSSIGTCPTETLGREFITSYMENCGTSSQFEVEITGYSAFTSVSVSVSNDTSGTPSFEKNILVNQGEVMQVKLPESVGIKNTFTKFSNVVLVRADKDISVVSISKKHQSLETTVLYPVSSLGNEYYIVTPSTEYSDSYPEFSVMTYEEKNSVNISVKGKLKAQYLTGSSLKYILTRFSGIRCKAIGDVSGTRIDAEKPVAVLVGRTCFCNNTKCNHVFEQLLPTCSWGTTYIIPPLPWQEVDDIVYISAAQNTSVFYQLGGQQENVTLTRGSVRQLPVKPSSPVFISADVSIQVVYYSRGAAVPNSSHTFLMHVPDVASYCLMYSINDQKGFKNYALFVANTSETGAIILDNQPLRDVVWHRISGTEFSWGVHELGTDNSPHVVKHPSSPFGLLSVGVSDTNSYGIPGSCRKNVLPFKCQAEALQIKEDLEKCKNVFLQGKPKSSNSQFCSFMNSTITNLETACAQNTAASLEEVARPFDSLLNSSILRGDGCESKEEVASAVTLLLQSVELSALAAALKSPNQTRQNATTEFMAIETLLIPGNCSQDEVFTLTAEDERMDIHCIPTTEDFEAIAFISYKSLNSVFTESFLDQGNLMGDKKLTNVSLNSRVVSGAVKNGTLDFFKPVNFILRHTQAKKEEEEVFCVHWKFIAGKGTWSQDGCTVLQTNPDCTICRCDHLSSFALLMGVATGKHSYALTIITYVGLTLSLLCLFLAILTFLLCRSIRNVSTSIHLHLCLCLFLADLLFLAGVTHTSHKVLCSVIAGFLHYLFLACFTWMFLEGLHLFLTVRNLKVVNYTSASRFKKRYMYPFGYGLPALIVAISAALKPEGYKNDDFCWLKRENDFLWSFLGPVCVIILINLIFFIVTLWILRSKLSSLNEGVSTLKDTRLLTFKAIAQLFILGCTWSLGLFQDGSEAKVSAYLFTIVNSLQGAFIFLVHCLLNRQVREEYRRWIKSWKPSPTTQTSGLSTSTNPFSTKMAGDPCDSVPRGAAWDCGTAEPSGLPLTPSSCNLHQE